MKPYILSKHAQDRFDFRFKSLTRPIEEIAQTGIELYPKMKTIMKYRKSGHQIVKYKWSCGYLFIIEEKRNCFLIITIIQKKLRGVLRNYTKLSKRPKRVCKDLGQASVKSPDNGNILHVDKKC
jgi:hypothetical protein